MKTLLFLLLIVPAFAKEETAQRTCRLLFLNAPPGALQEIYLYDGVEAKKVDLPSMNLSDVYPVSGAAPAVRLLAAPVAKPEEIPANAPTATLAKSVRDFFIIISPDPTNQSVPLRMQIIDAGGPTFSKGRMMWYNLTNDTVGGTLGERKLVLQPKSRAIVEPPINKQDSYPVELFHQAAGGPLQPICRTQWHHDPRARMLMFVHNSGNGGTPQVAGFKDFRMEPGKKD